MARSTQISSCGQDPCCWGGIESGREEEVKEKGRGGEGEDIFMKEGVLLVMGNGITEGVCKRVGGSDF